MIDKSKVTISDRVFIYESYYDRLEAEDGENPAIACPKCNNTLFSISYDTYQCVANCKCGHKMTIYDG